MDDIVIEVFEDVIKCYGGYIFVVYEVVMNIENNYWVM